MPASLEVVVMWGENDPHSRMPDSGESWAKLGTQAAILRPSPLPAPNERASTGSRQEGMQ